MKQSGKGISSYFIFIVLLVALIIGINSIRDIDNSYTREEFTADMEAGKVKEIIINPNRETPTGYLDIELTSGAEKKLYVTNVTDAETLVRSYGYDPEVRD